MNFKLGHFNSAFRLLAFPLMLQSPIYAQETGVVTFYSPSFPVKNQAVMPVTVKGTMPLRGRLFDGDQTLAQIKPGHYVSLNTSAGDHLYSANPTHPNKDKQVNLTVSPGGHYCFRLTESYVNYTLGLVATVEGHVEQVDCAQAKKEAEASKPIGTKEVSAEMRNRLSTSAF